MTTIMIRDTLGARISQSFVIYNIYGYGGAGVKGVGTFSFYLSNRDVFGARGASIFDGFTITRDRFGVKAHTLLIAYHRATVRDRAGVRSRATSSEVVNITSKDRAAIFASSHDVIHRIPSVRDRLGARAGVVGTQSSGLIIVKDQFGAYARARLYDSLLVHDVFGARGTGYPSTPSSLVSRGRFGATGRSSAWVDTHILLRDRLGARSQSHVVFDHKLFLRDRFLARGKGFVYRDSATLYEVGKEIPLTDTDVWTADIRSWGMSRYVQFPVTDMVGTQYGVSRDGVYTTSGMTGFSFIKTGVMMLSYRDEPMHRRKRINHVYTYSNNASPLDVVVSADYRGDRLTRRYTQDYYRGGGATRAARCTIGKGFASNYIQLAVGGTPFDLEQAEVEISPTGRRI